MAVEDAPDFPLSDQNHADGASTSGDSSGNEDDSSSDEELVEPLYAGRERRTNQGNRYLTLLTQEHQAEEDDEITALFQEDEEVDDEFPGSDADVEAEPDEDSSDTDNEDKGPTAGAEELDGEKQLEKEERAAKKAQKRKADKIITKSGPIRKKVKIDESVSTPELEDRKRKRSERTSWIPTTEPVRTSSRTLAVQNKERTTASLKESAARREQAIAIQQAAKKRKDAVKRRPKTQAEKLSEAAETEAINSKSLNKWQEMEEDRLRRQKARLEAMHNRKIEGPFIRWKSSRAEWTNGKVTKLGNMEIQVIEETHVKKAFKPAAPVDVISITQTTHQITPAPMTSAEASAPGSDQIIVGRAIDYADAAGPSHESPLQGPPKSGFATLMEEMEQYASRDQTKQNDPQDNTVIPALVEKEKELSPHPPTKPPDPILPSTHTTKPTPRADPTQAVSSTEMTPLVSASVLPPQFQTHPPSSTTTTTLQLPESPHSPKPEPDLSTRNALTLRNYSAATIAHLSIERHILLHTPLPSSLPNSTTRSNRASVGRPKAAAAAADQAPPKPVLALCAITGQPARYRDPLTGLPYANREAFAAIRRAVKGECVWSGILGAWVGKVGDGARGVPKGFWGGEVDGGVEVLKERDTVGGACCQVE